MKPVEVKTELVEQVVEPTVEVQEDVLPAEDTLLKDIISDVLMKYTDDKSQRYIADNVAEEILVEVNKYE